MSGSQRDDLLLGGERDEKVGRPVVVELDGQLRARDAERREQRSASANGSIVGTGCSIRPKTMRPDSSRSSVDGHVAAPGLERDHAELQRRPEHERRPERRVPRERQLEVRREDADARVAVALG